MKPIIIEKAMEIKRLKKLLDPLFSFELEVMDSGLYSEKQTLE